jgi:hypothetical protein
MCEYAGFWTLRGSNDLIFVVTKGERDIIKDFGSFMKKELTREAKTVFSPDKTTKWTIAPDWTKLISVEVQTKKWLKQERGCKDFHLKFYFTKQWAKDTLKGVFSEENYKKNLEGIAEYWSDDSVSHINDVLSNATQVNTIVTPDPLWAFLQHCVGLSLPTTKNFYLISSQYADEIKALRKGSK